MLWIDKLRIILAKQYWFLFGLVVIPRAEEAQRRFLRDIANADFVRSVTDGFQDDDGLPSSHSDHFAVCCRALPLVSLGKGGCGAGQIMNRLKQDRWTVGNNMK